MKSSPRSLAAQECLLPEDLAGFLPPLPRQLVRFHFEVGLAMPSYVVQMLNAFIQGSFLCEVPMGYKQNPSKSMCSLGSAVQPSFCWFLAIGLYPLHESSTHSGTISVPKAGLWSELCQSAAFAGAFWVIKFHGRQWEDVQLNTLCLHFLTWMIWGKKLRASMGLNGSKLRKSPVLCQGFVAQTSVRQCAAEMFRGPSEGLLLGGWSQYDHQRSATSGPDG